MSDEQSDLSTNPRNSASPAPSKLRWPRKPQSRRWRSALSTIAIIIIAPLIALCLTAYVFQSYQVDGPSMESTLMNNDRLIVNKIPRTWSRITGQAYIPKRGDIIIFSDADLGAALPGPTKQLIKRVIGLPGDHLVIQNGVVTIYNKQHPNGFDPDKTLGYFNGRTIPVTTVATGTINMIIPKDEVFVCGDNRIDSLDSRVFGPVPVKNIIGQLALRVLPINKVQDF